MRNKVIFRRCWYQSQGLLHSGFPPSGKVRKIFFSFLESQGIWPVFEVCIQLYLLHYNQTLRLRENKGNIFITGEWSGKVKEFCWLATCLSTCDWTEIDQPIIHIVWRHCLSIYCKLLCLNTNICCTVRQKLPWKVREFRQKMSVGTLYISNMIKEHFIVKFYFRCIYTRADPRFCEGWPKVKGGGYIRDVKESRRWRWCDGY